MNVTHVKVVNAGPFTDFETDLSLGSVGVFGRNGSGKTTLMRFVHAALTRRFNMFPGVKADLPLSSASGRADSYVEVHATHAGVDFETTLSLRERKTGPGRSRLKVHGEKELTAEPDIAARMAQFGLAPAVVDFAVFVYGVYDFIDLTPSKRAEVYRILCGTEKAQQAHKCLSGVLAGATVADVTVIDNSDQIAAAVGEAGLELEQLESRRLGLQERLAEPRFGRAQRLVRRRDRYLALSAEVQECRTLLDQLVGRRQELGDAADRISVKLVEVDRKVQAGRRAAADAERLLQESERQVALRRQRLKLRERVRSLSAAAPQPAADDDALTADELAARLAAVEALLQKDELQLSLLTAPARSDCPTCGQSLPAYTESQRARRTRELQARVDGFSSELASLRVRLLAQQRRASALAAWRDGEQRRLDALATSRESLASLGEDESDEVDADAAQALVDDHRALLDRQARLRERLNSAQVRHAKLGGHCEAAAARAGKLSASKVLLAGQPDEEKVRRAERLVSLRARLEQRVQQLAGAIRVTRKTLEARRRELAEVRRQAAHSQTRRRLRAVYERAADLLHWEGLPRRVASKTLARMSGLINDNLARLGGPFTVSATDGMSFDCALGDAPPRDMVWLSSGQRVLLAVSFWSAASVFAASPGLLVLDEPTANLDAANVDYLGGALTLLSGSVRGTRQVIMTTHADGLRASFDQVIELN